MIYNNCNHTPLTDEQRKLVSDNLLLVNWVLRKNSGYAHKLGRDDAFQIGCLGLMRAAQNFDPGRAKFITFATREIRNALIYNIRIENTLRRRPKDPIECLDSMEIENDDLPLDEQIERIVETRAARRILNKDALLRQYFELGKSQATIARELRMSKAEVSRSIRRRLTIARWLFEEA
jgi:RNA polymerase sporulation-specific sigma factor